MLRAPVTDSEKKIITVDFKSSIEVEDIFNRLLQTHPHGAAFTNYRKMYFDHPQLVSDLKRRLTHVRVETIDLACHLVEEANLKSVNQRVAGLAFQSDSWARFRINQTLRWLGLSQEHISPVGWLKNDDVKRIQFCMDMLAQADASPTGFTDQWNILRKAQGQIQMQIIGFLGRCPDPRAVAFLKAYAQLPDAELAPQACMELGRRSSAEITHFMEHLWKHHFQDPRWQAPLLVALRRLYLRPLVQV